MERLTFEGNFCDIAQCKEIPCPYNGACSQRKVWERLKAYEDTHMMPSDVTSMRMDMAIIAALFNGVDVDRMKELAEADKDGRLVVLPCKVGDTVYRIFNPPSREPVISAHTLMSVDYIVRWIDKFGKTVFLTREEAERALEAIKDD